MRKFKSQKLEAKSQKLKKFYILQLTFFFLFFTSWCILSFSCTSQEKKANENPLKKQISPKSNSNNPLEQYSAKMLETLDKAKEVNITASLSQIQSAMETYKMDNETYPVNLSNNLQELSGYLDTQKVLARFPNQQITSYKGSSDNYELVVETQKTIYTLTPFGINQKDK